jgi:hypothetical protein
MCDLGLQKLRLSLTPRYLKMGKHTQKYTQTFMGNYAFANYHSHSIQISYSLKSHSVPYKLKKPLRMVVEGTLKGNAPSGFVLWLNH